MSLKIRLARGGAKKRPFYSIVVADSRSPRDGRFIEKLGTFNPLLPKDSDQRVVLDLDKAASHDRPLVESARFGNLLRLARAMDKLALQGVRASPRTMFRFLEGYAGTRQAARSWFERLRARRVASRSWQGMWWRLTGQAKAPRSLRGGGVA